MAAIHTIRRKVLNKEYEFTIPHFFEEMANDYLAFTDVQHIIAHGRIRRKFTRDPRGTRYEVVGVLPDGRMVAVICRVKETGSLLLITTYIIDEL